MPHIYFLMRQPGDPDSVLVWDTRTIDVGRAPENAIVVEESDVSRRHAIFTREGDAFFVGDHQTGNGTFVNGQQIHGNHRITCGDVIGIGKLQLEFYVGDLHPAKRGFKLDHVSQRMTVGMLPSGGDPNSTMLGMAEGLPPAEDFVIEPERGQDQSAFSVNEIPELDLEIVAPDPASDPLRLEFEGDHVLDADPVLDGPVEDLRAPQQPAPQPAAPAAATPPPGESQTSQDPIERMKKLKTMHEAGLITDTEFQETRARILAAM
jgi:predicted component of type VI protein secretion system